MAITEHPPAYATPTQIIVQAAQDEVIALIVQFETYLGDGSASDQPVLPPDYINVPPAVGDMLRQHLTLMKAAIDAAPVS